MAAKPSMAIVGAGRLGRALAEALPRAGYPVVEIIRRDNSGWRRKTAARPKATTSALSNPRLDADLIWFCVPDREIANVARALATVTSCKNKIAFHSSGALASDELRFLRQRGASVASVHPLMTFVGGSRPSLKHVPFAVEGDRAAVRIAGRIARDLGGVAFAIRKQDKAAYHAWGAFTSPLVVALLATAEQVARRAGVTVDARKRMLPIVRQTIENYARLGPAGASSGPLVRGDAAIVSKHLRVLKAIPQAREVYLSLARATLTYLPVGNRKKLATILRSKPR